MTSGNSGSSTLATILGTTIVVGTLSSLGWYLYYTNNGGDAQSTGRRRRWNLTSNDNSGGDASSYADEAQTKFKPPFPTKIRNMLSQCRLAYLSTIDAEYSSSHLSLMRFTYWQHPTDGEVVIMSTNRHTKKYEFLKQQKGVALLVHDFGNGQDDNNIKGGMYSITLNGECRILPSGTPKAEEYRQKHLQHNPDYPQFIVGDSIDILCVDVSSARICDIQDQVVQWNVQDAAAGKEEEHPSTSTSTTPKTKVVPKTLVHIPYQSLQSIFGEGVTTDAAFAVTILPTSADAADSILFADRPQYDALRLNLSAQQQELLGTLLDKLQEAFGPGGLGFLEVTDIPIHMVQLRSTLLPMAERLALLPSATLQEAERPETGWTLGWSHGKEHFKDGTYDVAKGSFYINPFYDQQDPNIYPRPLQPYLQQLLIPMTRFMSEVGLWVGTLCDLYLQREGTASNDPWMISQSLATGIAAKARLLYYFPRDESKAVAVVKNDKTRTECGQDVVFDDWCGQHKDHGSITALLPGMLCDGTGSAPASDTSSSSKNDPHPPGLYIETRNGELVHASLAPTSLGFQLGETLQIMSRGKFRATPHSVKAPSATNQNSNHGRASLAVFLQPLAHQALPPLTEAGKANDDDGYGLERRWRGTFGEFQKATTDQFN